MKELRFCYTASNEFMFDSNADFAGFFGLADRLVHSEISLYDSKMLYVGRLGLLLKNRGTVLSEC